MLIGNRIQKQKARHLNTKFFWIPYSAIRKVDLWAHLMPQSSLYDGIRPVI